jgi:hypothetical protein
LDLNGNAVPNSGSGSFASDYLNPSGWKAGPIDFRWDESKGVWSAGGGSNVYRGITLENISPFGTGSGTIFAGSSTLNVRVESWLGQPVCSGQRIIVFQDSSSYYLQQAEFSPMGIMTNLTCPSGGGSFIMTRRNFYFPGAFSGSDIDTIGA